VSYRAIAIESNAQSTDPDIRAAGASHERETKRERVRSLLDASGAEAVVLTSAAALSWYLCGARVHVNIAGEPILAVRVSRDIDQVFVTSNELSRLAGEELPSDIELHVRRWDDEFEIAGSLPEHAMDAELRAARQSLLPVEVERYRALGVDTAAALTEALAQSRPHMTERELAAALAKLVIERGADPIVLLAAGHSRLRYRHPLPTDEYLGRRAMLVVCARRHGLIASATRWVTFGRMSIADRDAEQSIAGVEADILDATRPGVKLRDLVDVIKRAYSENGFSESEWMGHHQGGPAGYAPRDPKVTARSVGVVAPWQPFAWNPSAPQTKIEDTVVVLPQGIDILTVDPRWPTTAVSGRMRPVSIQL